MKNVNRLSNVQIQARIADWTRTSIGETILKDILSTIVNDADVFAEICSRRAELDSTMK